MKYARTLAGALALGAFAMMPAAHAQSTAANKGAYCHVTQQDARKCTFASLQQCQNIAKAQGGRCIENPSKGGMTGSAPAKSMNKMDSGKK